LRGALLFYDAQMERCERLTLAVAKAAAQNGACLLNYCELEKGTYTGGDWELGLLDRLDGSTRSVRARVIADISGAGSREVLSRLGGPEQNPARSYVRGIQLVLPQMSETYSLALESRQVDAASRLGRGGRSYFLVPWRGATLAGTFEIFEKHARAGSFHMEEAEQAEFLAELRAAYRSDLFSLENVRGSFGGFIPLERGIQSASSFRVAREDEIELGAGRSPLISVTGVKYTTFRALAERTVDHVCHFLGCSERRAQTSEAFLPGGKDAPVRENDSSELRHLKAVYGEEYEQVLAHVGNELRFLDESASITSAEVRYAAREEMAQTLEDVLFRRSTSGLEGSLTRAGREAAAKLLAEELHWSEERKTKELKALPIL